MFVSFYARGITSSDSVGLLAAWHSGKPNGTSPVSRLDFDLTFRPLLASPEPPRPLRTQRA